MVSGWRRATAILSVGLLITTGCQGFRRIERENVPPEQLKKWSAEETAKARKSSPFLKAHMRNGDLFVLSTWDTDSERDHVIGVGTHYDRMRRVVGQESLAIPIDSVALFETNVVKTSGAAVAIGVLVVATGAIAIYCLTNRKACFGSCPTFYLPGTDRPVAEGFSASIAPSLEATDVDALNVTARGGDPVEVVMKNEALETHVVRFVNLLAVPRPDGRPVFAGADGAFRSARTIHTPTAAMAQEGDCLAALAADDGHERFTFADSSNLAARETIEVEFADAPAGVLGLVIACRQSLLSTYVLYQTLAYMGSEAGHWIAEIERGRFQNTADAMIDLFGGIVVEVETSAGTWTRVGEVREFGPIATDRHMITFEASPDWSGRVRIDLNQGGWRIDQVALITPGAEVEPVRLAPVTVAKDGKQDDAALAILLDLERSLTTLPGDTYSLMYAVPDDGRRYDLFLESRGYYLEWMREEWMVEENASLLAEVFLDPKRALARMAPEFKKAEPRMEETFWNSRYGK